MVMQIEQEGLFPEANYAFDNGVLNLGMTRYYTYPHCQDKNLTLLRWIIYCLLALNLYCLSNQKIPVLVFDILMIDVVAQCCNT